MRLGPRANPGQLTLLVVVNAFVGAMVARRGDRVPVDGSSRRSA